MITSAPSSESRSGRTPDRTFAQTPEQTPEQAPNQAPAPQLTVLYDGACPLCRREIGVYRGLQPLQADAPVCFADVSDTNLVLPPGTTRAQLLARFHVRGRNGELLSGAQAFLSLWAALPGWRWLARLGQLPGAVWLMERLYRLFLRWRPALQRWALRLEPPTPSPPQAQAQAQAQAQVQVQVQAQDSAPR